MIIEVLSLGESLSNYRPNGRFTIGVNDIFRFHRVDHLVVADKPDRFYGERFNTEHDKLRYDAIINSTPKKFITPIVEWCTLVKNFHLVATNPVRGEVNKLDESKYCNSNTSTFLACVHAYKLGASRIILHGADFNTHFVLSNPINQRRILKDFKALRDKMHSKGVSLMVSSEHSLLAQVLAMKKD